MRFAKQFNRALRFAAMGMVFSTSSMAATMIVDRGFETGELTGLVCSGNCPTVVSSPTAAGSKFSGSFALTRDMRIPYRTEITFGPKGKFEFGKEYWVGFNYRFEDWERDGSPEMAPFQVHEATLDWDATCGWGSAVGNAPFYMLTQHGKVEFRVYRSRTMWEEPIVRGKWAGMTLHFKISPNDDGFIEAWKDGEKLFSTTGKNTNGLDKCGRPMKPTYMKMGIYKWDWKAGRPDTQSSRRELFLDNLKIASGEDGFALVSTPVEALPPPPPPPPPEPTPTDIPVISGAGAVVNGTTATVSWVSQAQKGSARITHSVVLTGLTPGSVVSYVIKATNSKDKVTASETLTFTVPEIEPEPELP